MAENSAQVAKADLKVVDPIWHEVRREAEAIIQHEPQLASFIYGAVVNQASLDEAIMTRVAQRLDSNALSGQVILDAYRDVFANDKTLAEKFRVDLAAVYDRDPACDRFIEPLLYFKGFHALQAHRLSHALFAEGRVDFALFLQARISAAFQVDIHPRVPVGKGVFIDHATGIVVGGTAVIEDNVSILQNVTLGGTGKEDGDRHPKIRAGSLIGAGANVLGNIEVGHCSRVAAGSVVLQPVPANKTVAGVPAKIVGEAGCSEPARSMDQILATKEAVE